MPGPWVTELLRITVRPRAVSLNCMLDRDQTLTPNSKTNFAYPKVLQCFRTVVFIFFGVLIVATSFRRLALINWSITQSIKSIDRLADRSICCINDIRSSLIDRLYKTLDPEIPKMTKFESFFMAPCPCDVKYLAQQMRNISNTCHFNTCKKSWRNWAEVVLFYTWGGGVYFF